MSSGAPHIKHSDAGLIPPSHLVGIGADLGVVLEPDQPQQAVIIGWLLLRPNPEPAMIRIELLRHAGSPDWILSLIPPSRVFRAIASRKKEVLIFFPLTLPFPPLVHAGNKYRVDSGGRGCCRSLFICVLILYSSTSNTAWMRRVLL